MDKHHKPNTEVRTNLFQPKYSHLAASTPFPVPWVESILEQILVLKLFLFSVRYDFSYIDTSKQSLMRSEKKNTKNIVLSFLMNVGGGVLLANCFLHWLPEVREGVTQIQTKT